MQTKKTKKKKRDRARECERRGRKKGGGLRRNKGSPFYGEKLFMKSKEKKGAPQKTQMEKTKQKNKDQQKKNN